MPIAAHYITTLSLHIIALLAFEELSTYAYLCRKHDISKKRLCYSWHHVPGLPGQFQLPSDNDAIPEHLKSNINKKVDPLTVYGRKLASTGANGIKSMFENWDIMDDYNKLLAHICKERKIVHDVAKRWMDDVEFGRQFMNGVHPVKLRRISRIPESMKVTHGMLKESLQRGLTLEDEAKVSETSLYKTKNDVYTLIIIYII